MMMTFNDYGQPLGLPVANWQGARTPQRVVLHGRCCRVEPFSAQRHGAGLRAALALDTTAEGWAYLMPQPTDDAAFAEWFASMEQSNDPLFFAIVDAGSGQAVGIASYLRIDAANGVIEVGWLRFSPLLQRTVAATEAMYLMMRQAFEWGYRRYEWKSNALNAASVRAAQRLGFTFEGIFRQARVNWGVNRDTAWFSLLDSEWPQQRLVLEAWLAAANFDATGQQRQSLQACRQALGAGLAASGVRLARLADLAALGELFDGYRCFYGRQNDAVASLQFIRQRLLDGDSTILVAEQGGSLCGFVQLYPLFSSVSVRPVWLLNDLFVAQSARRAGVGKALLQGAAALARERGVLRLMLATAHDNRPAQALYERLGWQPDADFRHYQLALN